MKIFISHSYKDRELADSVVSILQEDGHTVFRPDEVTVATHLLSEISAAIRSAHVLVAIVTGSNANIFFELGLAAGASVPTLISAPAGEHLPADLASIPFVQLTGDMLRDAQMIVRRIKDLEGLSSTRAVTFQSAEESLRAASLDPAVLESLPPSKFEQLVADLFKERGFDVLTKPPTHDAGVDLVVKSPKDNQVLLVEVKKLSRQSRVSVEAVRRLLGAVSLTTGALGVLVSTSGFTAAASALAAGTPLVLRTLDDILAAKSKSDLLKMKKDIARIIDIFKVGDKVRIPYLTPPDLLLDGDVFIWTSEMEKYRAKIAVITEIKNGKFAMLDIDSGARLWPLSWLVNYTTY